MLYENEQLFAKILYYISWDPMVKQTSSTGKQYVHFKKIMKFWQFSVWNIIFGKVLSVQKVNKHKSSTLKNSFVDG